jgi:hypothetical protein
MERAIGHKSSRLQTIRRCISVAFHQARQSEVEVPSKRSFRLLYETGNAPAAQPHNTSPGGKDLVARAGVGLQTFLSCCSEANQRARQSEIDVLARRSYRENHETGSKETGFQVHELEERERSAGDQKAPHEGGSVPFLVKAS